MSESKPVRPEKVSLKVSDDGIAGRLTFIGADGEKACIETSLQALQWFAGQIPQLIVDSLGERALGEKSAVSPDRSAPPTNITTRVVDTFVLIGYEAGGRVVDVRTTTGEVIRLGLSPEIATNLSLALAPGGDQTPENATKN